MTAIVDLDRLGINPIEGLARTITELQALKDEALSAYKQMRGYGERADAGTQYLASAIKAVKDQADIYTTMAKFKHPTLTAVAVKDLTEDTESKAPMTTLDAVKIIQADPFAPKEIKEISSERIVDAVTSTIDTPFLPIGNK